MANGIYMILCIKSNRAYIGESSNLSHRISHHKQYLKANTHYSKELQNDWNQFGENFFVFKILEQDSKFTSQSRKEKELYWIDFYKNDDTICVCNIRYGDTYISESGNKSRAEKMSLRMAGENHPMWGKKGYWAGKKRPQEIVEKMAQKLKGQKRSYEARKKMSDAKIGKEPHNKFPITPELLEDIEKGISYKDFESKYGKSKNTLKRIKRELKGEKRIRIRTIQRED